MPLRFVLDEHLRGPLWRAIFRHNLSNEFHLDAVRVGDSPDLPLGLDDASILRWAEREDRILVTEDAHSMATHLKDHLEAGRHSPGVFMLRPSCSLREVTTFLVLAAYASEPDEWRDRIEYV